MPELPEVETMCRGLQPIIGRQIRAIFAPPCPCRPIATEPSIATIDRRLRGLRITGISRLGKRVLLEVGEWILVLQPKMSGLVSLDQVPDPSHVRLCIELSGRPRRSVRFWDRRGLGTIRLLARGQLQARLVDGRLGPDALEISVLQFRQRLAATRRAIKVALLDQKLLAGVGNLYASELLHLARIHPAAPANRLSLQQVSRLHRAMGQVLHQAIAYEGSTLADGTYRNALNDPGSYQNQHRVYDRAGQTCPTCKRATIQRIVQAQRSTYFCPRCQQLPTRPGGRSPAR